MGLKTALLILKYVLLILGSYCIGNISWARIISKNVLKSDITKKGSGNAGTSNMYRSYGLKAGIATLVLDLLKGVVPALIGRLLLGIEWAFILGTASIIGHIFPVFLKFKGGKGIATALGMFWVVSPLWMSVVFVIMFIFIFWFEYMAPINLLAISALVCIEGYKHTGNFLICSLLFVVFVLIWWAHRQNIERMLVGKENKVSLRSSIAERRKKKKEISKEVRKEE